MTSERASDSPGLLYPKSLFYTASTSEAIDSACMNSHCKLKTVDLVVLLLSCQYASGLASYPSRGSAVRETSQSNSRRSRQGLSPLQKHIQHRKARGDAPISLHAFNRILIWAWVVSTYLTLCSAYDIVRVARLRVAACATRLTNQFPHPVCAFSAERLCEQDLASAGCMPSGQGARESAEQGVQSHPAVLQQPP